MAAVIAVAGGTGPLGRAIVQAIKARKNNDVLILSRRENDQIARQSGATVIAVDYSNVASLCSVLEVNQVSTVVSAMTSMVSEEQSPEIGLIRAAHDSICTKRFVPSNWCMPIEELHRNVLGAVPSKLESLRELANTTLEYTEFYTGFFMDFFEFPAIPTYLSPFAPFIDFANGSAAIPGLGNTPVVFTHTSDIAKFVAAALELPRWDRGSYIIGDKVTWNEFLKMAEEAKGCKFKVTHDNPDKLQGGEVTFLPSYDNLLKSIPRQQLASLFAGFGILCHDGSWNFEPENTLNELFPEIEPMKVKYAMDSIKRN